MNVFLKNIEWIFSGIGVFVLTMLFTFISKRRKKKLNKASLSSSQTVDNSNFSNSPTTNVTGKRVHYQQNIYGDKNGEGNIGTYDSPVITSGDLLKTKENYLLQKNGLRTFIYKVISPAMNVNKIIEVRHVVDKAEKELDVAYKVILHELKEMEQEGIIELQHENDPNHVSPYTRIILTSKFFTTIKPKF